MRILGNARERRTSSTRLWASCLVTSSQALACVTPGYRDDHDAALQGDASSTSAQAHDASAQESDDAQPSTRVSDAQLATEVPAWAAAASGTYAVRQRFFGRGTGVASAINELSSEWLWLSTVRYDVARAQLHMSAQLCSATGTNAFGNVLVNVTVSYPTQLPRHEWDIMQVDGGWRTHGDPDTQYGFQSAPLVACTAGLQTPCAPEQKTWLPGGQCTCPADQSVLPSTVEDCRIDDDDQDGEPGYTVRATGGIQQTYFVRSVDKSELVKGSFGSDGALSAAGYTQSVDTLQIGCNPEPCARADSTPCDPGLNPVEFERVAAGDQATTLTCADVVMQSATLFSAAPFVFPAGGC